MSGLQWVNAGFFRGFGYAAPLDFADPDFLLKMSQTTVDLELRRQIANSFRDFAVDGYSRTPLSRIYGDAMSLGRIRRIWAAQRPFRRPSSNA